MAIARVQTTKGSSIGGTTVSASWNATTTAGNLLVACVFITPNGTITPPSGWSSCTALSTSSTVQIFYYTNAPAQNATGNFTYSTGASNIVLHEYSGCDTTSPLDQQATNNASSTTANTGTTGTTTLADEVCFGAVVSVGTANYSAPTNSFAIITTNKPSGSSMATVERIVSSTGTYTCSCTQSGSAANWWGAIATFKQAAATSFSANGSGNAILGSAAPTLLRFTGTPTGLMTLAGSDTVLPTYLYTLVSGNGVLAGAAAGALSFSPQASGVVSLGGTASATIIVYAAAGGEVVVEGSAFYSPTIVYAASGGMNLGNTSGASLALSYGASGVFYLGGAAGVSGLLVVQADGGLLLAGAGAVSFLLPYVPSGVLLLQGTSPTTLQIHVVCLVAGTKAERRLQGQRQAQQRLRAGRKMERQLTGLRGICPGTAQ